MEQHSKKILTAQKRSLDVWIDGTQKTFVVAAFVDPNYESNTTRIIPCAQGAAISGYAYDCTTDSYIIECCGHLNIGYIDACCYLRLHDKYEIRIPISDSVCKMLFNENQTSILKSHIKSMGFQKHQVVFLQSVCDY